MRIVKNTYCTSYDTVVWNTSFICNCYILALLQGCKPVIYSNDYPSYLISDSDTVACCRNHRGGCCHLFHIIVCYWLD